MRDSSCCKRPHAPLFIVAAFTAALAGGCGKAQQQPAPRPAEVTVVKVATRDTPIWVEFVGQTQSSREVEIRARVDGFLEKRRYQEGDLVKAGQIMFEMDRKPFQATLQQAHGELAQQQARLQVAKANLARVKPLAEQNAVSKKDLDDAIGNEQQAQAAVLAAQGQVRTAELNLGYANISSPLNGISSFAKVQDGAYVSAQNNLLTTVAQLDPIWVNFSVSENEILKYREQETKGQLLMPKDRNFDVEVMLADGSAYPDRGRISFADPSFSKETGTFLVRAQMANAKAVLRPGQFVKVRLHGAVRPNAILVPQRAVQQGAKGHFVWVVGSEGKAEPRVVDVGDWYGDDWFINQGLGAGDVVVVDGAIRVAAGAPVKVSAAAPTAAKPPSEGAPKEPPATEKDKSAGKTVSQGASPAKN